MKSSFIMRLIGLLVFASTAGAIGSQLAFLPMPQWFPSDDPKTTFAIITGVIGGIVGYIVAPSLIERPLESLRHTIQQLPAQTLVSAIVGLFAGLAFGAMGAYPTSLLPTPLGQVLPAIVALGFGYLGMTIGTLRPDLLQGVKLRLLGKDNGHEKREYHRPPILLDTSVIIDGRIADICRTGFIQGELIVPLFVLNELQHVADSADKLRRNRGRRGLEILRQLQEESPVPVHITDEDDPTVREVDDKLIALAKKLGGAILTNDYNLNRVAELQSIPVLNVNELANAVKTVLLPGESFTVHVLQEGKEPDQGVGYLDDGTMVVIEGGIHYIGTTIEVVVSKVLQTAAGRMIFARPT